jgi:hypothetical protein
MSDINTFSNKYGYELVIKTQYILKIEQVHIFFEEFRSLNYDVRFYIRMNERKECEYKIYLWLNQNDKNLNEKVYNSLLNRNQTIE